MNFLNWFKGIWKDKELQVSDFNPRPVCLKAIEDKPCIPDICVCRHKCIDVYKCFKKHGQKSKVVRGRVKRLREDHVWMELENKGELYWYDPTWYNRNPAKYGCHKASQWTDRKVLRDKTYGVKKATGDTSPPRRMS